MQRNTPSRPRRERGAEFLTERWEDEGRFLILQRDRAGQILEALVGDERELFGLRFEPGGRLLVGRTEVELGPPPGWSDRPGDVEDALEPATRELGEWLRTPPAPACPDCKRVNRAEALFCAGCGRPLVCRRCRKSVGNAPARFCDGCGSPLLC